MRLPREAAGSALTLTQWRSTLALERLRLLGLAGALDEAALTTH